MKKVFRIISRKSALALWQSNFVKHQLQSLYPHLEIEIISILSDGDKNLKLPLSQMGGQGIFVHALENYLLNNQADIAVHSLKDMPILQTDGLELAAILKREDPREALISIDFQSLADLPRGARVGTSSLRRQSQLYALRRDLLPIDLRGSVDNRILQLKNKDYDALILAVAGVKRLELSNHIVEYLSIDQMLPEAGQGALGIECRLNDHQTKALLEPLHHLSSAQCVLAERHLNRVLEGTPQLAIAAFATIENDGLLKLQGRIMSPDGHKMVEASAKGPPERNELIANQVADKLLAKGAKAIMDACQQVSP